MNKWAITIAVFGGFVVFSMIFFAINGFNQISLQTEISLSARFSFLLFVTSFSAYPLYKISGKSTTNWLLKNRKYFGVAFGAIHFYHLGLLIVKNRVFEPVFSQVNTISLIVGIITYTFVGLMVLTSFPIISKNLSEKEWPKLHTIGGYVILTVFTIFYLRATLKDMNYLPLLIIALSLWILRLGFKKFIKS